MLKSMPLRFWILLLMAGLKEPLLRPFCKYDGNKVGFWIMKPSKSVLKKVMSVVMSLLKNEPRRLTENSLRWMKSSEGFLLMVE